jgi:hypothetical protein
VPIGPKRTPRLWLVSVGVATVAWLADLVGRLVLEIIKPLSRYYA